jgi:anti-sigma regulatory factor (Ser/Thr protein kinase)
MDATAASSVRSPFAHTALFYRDDAEYLAGVVPFIMKGLAAEEPVSVAVPGDRLTLLRAELGAATDDMTLLDMTDVGRNPGRIIPVVLFAFADTHPDRHVRVVGEPVWPDRRPDEEVACVRHEALVNRAFAGRDVTILCPYDTAKLLPGTISDARRTHPHVVEDAGCVPSLEYTPDDALSATNVALWPPPDPTTLVVDTPDMSELRGWAGAFATAHGMTEERGQDLVLALTELVSNSIEHARGPANVLLGRLDSRLVAQVRDRGRLTDPLAGRVPVPPTRLRGRGLLLVNRLADLVRMHTTTTGTTVEIQFGVV